MSGIDIIGIELIAPLMILIVYGRIKIARTRRKAAVDDIAPVPAFEPKLEPEPGLFLRHFSVPQRAYLRQQIALGRAFYYIGAWIFLIIFTSGLLPPFVNTYGLQQPLAQRVWYSYLEHISVGQIVLGFIMLMGAGIASSGLTTGATGAFNRTRPLTLRFLFWARILSAIATFLASLATAATVSFVLLLVFYGPVWLHLLDTMKSGTVLSQQQYGHLIRLLQSSALRLFLSLATTTLLIFSAALLVFSPSSRFLSKRVGQPIVLVVSIIAVQMARDFRGLSNSLFSRIFFLYTGLGPPPPYAHLFIPILASAALLFLAQVLIRRVEI